MRRTVLTTVLGLLLAAIVAAPLRADEGAARFFSDRGAKALDEKNLDEAERNYTKALGEMEGYLPALLGLAKVWNEREDKARAVGYLEQILDRRDRGGLSADDSKVADEAVDMLKDIDPPRLEYREMVRDYVDKLVDLAERWAKKSPDLARRCLDRILRVAPDHPAVKRLTEELGVVPSAPDGPGSAASPAAANETPLFNGKDLDDWDGGGKVWHIQDGNLICTPGDQAYYIRHLKSLEGDYTLVYEMKVTEDTGEVPAVGFSFGFTGEYQLYRLMMFSNDFKLYHYHGSFEDREILAEVNFYQLKGGLDRSVFNHYEIRVKGHRVTCLVNGREICHYEAPENVFAGYPALLVQGCNAEFRKIAVIQ